MPTVDNINVDFCARLGCGAMYNQIRNRPGRFFAPSKYFKISVWFIVRPPFLYR